MAEAIKDFAFYGHGSLEMTRLHPHDLTINMGQRWLANHLRADLYGAKLYDAELDQTRKEYAGS